MQLVLLSFSVIKILKVFPSGWVTMNGDSVHRIAKSSPWRKTICFQNYSLNKITIGSVTAVLSVSALLSKEAITD